ncbi:hypothetical protein ACFVJH_34590 [Streptomyces decoyicus]|uniref:hypothetical protein n=1 Tax=Streptomyces decoyicus TaxID=249567 RepID=UPI003625ABB2
MSWLREAGEQDADRLELEAKMARRDHIGPGADGLSTEDLAGTRQDVGSTAQEPPAQEPLAQESASEAPPTFPGEATAADRRAPTPEDDGGSPRPEQNLESQAQETDAPLLGPEQEEFRSRWQGIQSEFVDDPRKAVGAADTLVAEVMQALATTFSEHNKGSRASGTAARKWQRKNYVSPSSDTAPSSTASSTPDARPSRSQAQRNSQRQLGAPERPRLPLPGPADE